MIERYVVRYRAHLQGAVLIVEDGAGTAWLFMEGSLHCFLPRRAAADRTAPLRLAARLGGLARWTRVPEVAPYSLAGLQHLVEGTLRSPQRHTAPTVALEPARHHGPHRSARSA